MPAGGADQVIKIRVDVPSSTTDGASITDTASVSGNELETSTTNNADSAIPATSVPAVQTCALPISPDPVNAGGTVTYTLTVHNAGPSDPKSTPLNYSHRCISYAAFCSFKITCLIDCATKAQHSDYTSDNSISLASMPAAGTAQSFTI